MKMYICCRCRYICISTNYYIWICIRLTPHICPEIFGYAWLALNKNKTEGGEKHERRFMKMLLDFWPSLCILMGAVKL